MRVQNYVADNMKYQHAGVVDKRGGFLYKHLYLDQISLSVL